MRWGRVTLTRSFTMDPGSLLGGAVVGFGITAIMQEVIRKLNNLARRMRLLKFTRRLRRLQGPVSVLCKAVQKGRDSREHPAHEWLQDLQEQLHRLDNLLMQYSGGMVEWLGTSDELAEVDREILQLLQEEPLVYDAERLWCLSEALKTGPQELRQKMVCRTYSHFQGTTELDRHFGYDGGSSSSTAEVDVSEEEFISLGISIRPDDSAEPEIRYGQDGLAQKLIANLIKENKPTKWFGLWAMGGAGKIFIAKEVFHDQKIAEHFKGGKFWLTVSNQPVQYAVFLLRDLWKQAQDEKNDEKFPKSLEYAKAKVKELLNKKNVLLVLDDVWDCKMLGHLDVISEGNGRVILVTTRDEGIFRSDENSRSIAGAAEIEQVRPFSEEDSLNLFAWHAFRQRQFPPPEELGTVARSIVSECKGLPLALKVIGSAMGDPSLSRMDKMQGRTLCDKWEEQLARMRRADLEGDRYNALYGRLQLSVDRLGEEDLQLRDSFFYFAAYPEDYEIRIDALADLWVAEGVVGNNALLPRKTKARAFLALLVGKSMIVLVVGVRYKVGFRCKVHDVMRDLAFCNLRGVIGSGQKCVVSQWECLYEPSWKLAEFPSQWTKSMTPLDVKRLSLLGGDVRWLPHSFSARHLQVLLLHGNMNLEALPLGFFIPLSFLRVLDLSGTGIVKLSGKVLRNLKSLVLLDVTDCNNLRKIYRTLETLQILETIRSQYCHETFRFPFLKCLPELTTLETDVSQKTGSRGLMKDAFCRNASPRYFLEPHKSLTSLKLRKWCNVSTSPDVSSLTALEFLHLRFLPLPRGILQLHRLRKLYIEGDGEEFPALDELPALQDLTILARSLETAPRRQGLPKSFGRKDAFPALTRLELVDMKLESFVFHPGAMPVIESLEIWKGALPWENLPRSLSELHSLRSLRLSSRSCTENLSDVFSDPNYFPKLSTLELDVGEMRPPPVKFLPALNCLMLVIPEGEWPQDVVALQEEGKLEVQIAKPLPHYSLRAYLDDTALHVHGYC